MERRKQIANVAKLGAKRKDRDKRKTREERRSEENREAKKSSEEADRGEEEQTVGIARLRGTAKGCQGR